MTKSSSDNLLFDRFKSGDQAAFKVVHDRYYHKVLRYARSFITAEEEIGDIASEAFIRLYQSRDKMSNFGHINNFLYTVTRNYIFNVIKEKQTEKLSKKEYFYLSKRSESYFEQKRIETDFLQILYDEIESLPQQVKEVFNLILDGLSVREIANQMGITPQTVLNHKTLGIKALKPKFMSNEFVICFLALVFLLQDLHVV